LRRLGEQVDAYSAVFDRATVVIGRRHLKDIQKFVPRWWGITAATASQRGAVHFETVRRAASNPSTDDFVVAQLLWRNEAEEELVKRGVSGRILRRERSILYRELLHVLGARELRKVVRERLRSRTDWRCPARLSPDGGSSRPCAT
jgi:hypothetical protein